MTARAIFQIGVCGLVAIATGCTSFSAPWQTSGSPNRGKSDTPFIDNTGSDVSRPVVPARGTQPNDSFEQTGLPIGYQSPAGTANNPLPPPRPLPIPTAPGWGTTQPNSTNPSGPPWMQNPNVRTDPTAMGKHWELGPRETPTERLAEITRHLETLLTQNRDLSARIVELERLAQLREQSLVEAMRTVETAESEIAKTRAALAAQKAEIAALQSTIQQMEADELKFLAELIQELKKIVAARGNP